LCQTRLSISLASGKHYGRELAAHMAGYDFNHLEQIRKMLV
jgi:hypothetical protein